MPLIIQFSLTFACAVVIALAVTPIVRACAIRWKVVDEPNLERKVHMKPVALMGGLALVIAFIVTVVLIAWFGWIPDQFVSIPTLCALFAACGVVAVLGSIDDARRLTWWQQLVGPILAAWILIAAGLDIPFITSPFGKGILHLDAVSVGAFILPIGPILVFLWLMGMMYTTKLLDGIDGLATSISGVGALVIFVVSLFWDQSGSTTSFLSLAIAGSAFGFLVWNWHPAGIFLGEGGSIVLGLVLGVLAILSGGKIATALLVMGLPILDVVWIIIRRIATGSPVFVGDDKHLHFRLLRAGLSQRQIVVFMSAVSLLFGSVSFFFTTRVKLIALALLVGIMVVLGIYLVKRYEKISHPR